MTPSNQDRLKGLLGVMVRRHVRQDRPSHPVGQLIADEALRLRGECATSGSALDSAARDADQQLVDRLYRRFLLPRHETVEAFAECETVTKR